MSRKVFDFTFVDLFAGIGGFHQALQDEGGRCVMAVELDSQCQEVYKCLFPNRGKGRYQLVDNIRELTFAEDGNPRPLLAADDAVSQEGEESSLLQSVDELVPDHDVLCAGFPCQPFSKSGRQEGVEDRTRGTLFFDIMRIVSAKKPKFVLLENVRNLAGPRHTDTWATIIEKLEAAGYAVSSEPLILSPHRFSQTDGGAPQVRERVFILAYRHDGEKVLAPVPSLALSFDPNDWKIEDFLDDDAGILNLVDYQLSKDELAWVRAWQAFIRGIRTKTLPGFPIWVDAFMQDPEIKDEDPEWKQDFLRKNSVFYNENREFIDKWLLRKWGKAGTVANFPTSRRKFEWQARKAQPLRKDRDLSKLVLQFRPSGIRVKPPTYLPALVAITQTSVIGSRMRRITPREAARLQGMDAVRFAAALEKSGVGDAAAYKQLGNAVNVGMVRLAARALFTDRASWLPKNKSSAA